MTFKNALLAAGMAAAIGLASAVPAVAHGPQGQVPQQPYGWHYGWHMGPTGPGMMGYGCPMAPGYGMQGQQMMGPGMMGPGMQGQGMMGYGMMGPGMQGQGMMGPGMGYGMMGPGYDNDQDAMPMGPGMRGQGMGQGMGPGMQQPQRDLSADDVKRAMERQLAWQGNPHLKLGKVEEKDGDTIVAEVVTQDGSLVERYEVDRHTGGMRVVR